MPIPDGSQVGPFEQTGIEFSGSLLRGGHMHEVADYQLVKALGQGNQGQFFLALRPARLGDGSEYVAVKVLTAPNTEDALRRTSRELRAFASAQSPHLVSILDAGQDADRFFYTVEYFPRGSLGRPADTISPAEMLRGLEHAALAAHALHEVGIVHRGIKPTNVLLTDNGAKLSDLGLAQMLAPGQKVTSMGPIGAVEYMDPLLLQGEPGSRATDIWSLGVTMHEVLTGARIYGDLALNDPLLMVQRVLTTRPTLNGHLNDGEREIVAACLAPAPQDRPMTAEVVAERIAALV